MGNSPNFEFRRMTTVRLLTSQRNAFVSQLSEPAETEFALALAAAAAAQLEFN